MNCREFEKIIVDYAGSRPMDAGARARARSHVEVCPSCAGRLEEERTLVASLGLLASHDEGREASPDVESALLVAFRAGRREPPRPAPARRLSPFWMLAAAAALLLVCGLAAYRLLVRSPRPEPFASATAPVLRQTAAAAESKPPAAMPAARPARRPRAPFIREEMTLFADEGEGAGEVTTDFLTLDYSEHPAPMESGQLIRVQLPRAALARFGLPVNPERADVPVKADLLVGEDGFARAIRFVR